MIKTISYDQEEILTNIIKLYCNDKIDADVTYSKGNFYKKIKRPNFTSDLYPQDDMTIKCNANNLSVENESFESLMFDPPFLAGYTKEKPSGIIGNRFHGFRYISDLWSWYSSCFPEFKRVIKNKGILIIKCQDTVSSGRQHLSHVYIINEAAKHGFYCKDLFVLLAKSRIVGHNHKSQKHARKFHSYFLVFEKNQKPLKSSSELSKV